MKIQGQLMKPLTIASILLGLGLVGCGDDGGGGGGDDADGGTSTTDSSNTGDSDETTPPADDDETTPPADDDETTPPADDDDTTEAPTDEPTDEPTDSTSTDEPTDSTSTDEPTDEPTDVTGTDEPTDVTSTDEPATMTDGGIVDPPADGTLNNLIAAICDWEFRCCDRGELDYRLGDGVAAATDCAENFQFELNEQNSANNPYVSGSGVALLGTLGYDVDLTRVEVNAAGVAECIASYEALGCAEPFEPGARCDGPPVGTAPCALSNLFNPLLEQGERCTLALTQGAENDAECLPGLTCLDANNNNPDNPNEFPACVSRGLTGDPCTLDDDCDYDFYCDNANDCAPKGDVGDPCSFEDPEAPLPDEVDAACKAGLTCNPVELECVPSCTVDYTCFSDLECPAEQSCAPLTVGNDTASFRTCRALGNAATERCDDDADCVTGRYCNGSGVCASDAAEDAPCTVDGQCPAGTYCSDVTLACTPYTLPGAMCTRLVDNSSEQCQPSSAGCIYDGTDMQTECSATKRPNGQDCLVDYDCQSALCELENAADLALSCVAGAEAGDDCDDVVATADALRCAPGLACVNGECEVLLPPGGDCENPDTAAADSTLCANTDCRANWDESNTFLCSDSPVPETAGGTGLICDGP